MFFQVRSYPFLLLRTAGVISTVGSPQKGSFRETLNLKIIKIYKQLVYGRRIFDIAATLESIIKKSPRKVFIESVGRSPTEFEPVTQWLHMQEVESGM